MPEHSHGFEEMEIPANKRTGHYDALVGKVYYTDLALNPSAGRMIGGGGASCVLFLLSCRSGCMVSQLIHLLTLLHFFLLSLPFCLFPLYLCLLIYLFFSESSMPLILSFSYYLSFSASLMPPFLSIYISIYPPLSLYFPSCFPLSMCSSNIQFLS